MWYLKHDFLEKQEGLNEPISKDFFTRPCSEKEFEFIAKSIAKVQCGEDFQVPDFLELPEEYSALLEYSNGGLIVNEEREFGYFDGATIREFYINYGFIKYAPKMLPIAFNGGGTFYVYNFEDNYLKPSIAAVHASCVGDDDLTCFLGNTLDEVLSKTINIDSEIDAKQSKIELSDSQKNRIELNTKRSELKIALRALNESRNIGDIDLKTFLKSKKVIEQKLKALD